MQSLLVTDRKIFSLYSSFIHSFCGKNNTCLVLPTGEKYKTRKIKAAIEDLLIEKGFTSHLHFIALGGGVITDLIGFLASTWCRGSKLTLIPTTLLCMVDASIGGKTGVNVERRKNWIGTLYHPDHVYLFPFFLQTLPPPLLKEGMVEMLKHALLYDREFFFSLAYSYQNSLLPSLEDIEKAREIKRRYIAQDIEGRGVRHTLNLGHTFAHALEAFSHFTISHGAAVAFGIHVEAYIAKELGILSLQDFLSIEQLFAPEDSFISCLRSPVLRNLLYIDKKNKNTKSLSLPLLRAIGTPWQEQTNYLYSISSKQIDQYLDSYVMRYTLSHTIS